MRNRITQGAHTQGGVVESEVSSAFDSSKVDVVGENMQANL